MNIKPEHQAGFDWAVAHFNDGRSADDFAQEAIDGMGAGFMSSRQAELDVLFVSGVKRDPTKLAAGVTFVSLTPDKQQAVVDYMATLLESPEVVDPPSVDPIQTPAVVR